MREFFPDRIQRADLIFEMHKLTKRNFKGGILAILTGGILFTLFFFFIGGDELPIIFWIGIGGISSFAFLLGIWFIIHSVYSEHKGFVNYRYYICTVVNKQTRKGDKTYIFYVMYNNMQGKEKRIRVEWDFYNNLEIGIEFIMAKNKGGKLLLPNIFNNTPIE
ncbi:MAG: hypothetical protein LBC82_01505 [Oscillospiraceae bacterium]|jgi:hypothetical protein|nr:hypothetical protein [Oscillospiraceae bacterium]